MGLIAPVLPGYARSLGGTAALVGLLLAGSGIGRLLATLLTGWMGEHVGHGRLLVGAPALSAGAAVVCATTGSAPALAVFCLAEGLGAAVYGTAGAAVVVAGAGPTNRGRAVSGYQTATLLGAALGPVMGGLVDQSFGERAPFLVYAGLATAVAWSTRRWLGPTDTRNPNESVMHPVPRPSWRLLITPAFGSLWLVAFALVFARVAAQTAAPLLGAWRLDLSTPTIGLAMSLGGIAAVAGSLPAGWLADHWGRRATLLTGGLAMVGALTLLAVGRDALTFAAALASLGAASGLAGPAPAAQLADAVAADEQTSAVGLYRAIGAGAAALAPPVLGWLVD